MKIFKKKEKVTPQQALEKMRNAISILEKREEFLLHKAEKEQEKAKEALQKKNKKLALQHLKRKKVIENVVEKTQNQKLTLETQMMALEGANMNKEALSAMETGQKSLKAIHKDMDADKVDELMDDIRDTQDVADQITDALGQTLGDSNLIDEDDLEDELLALESDALDEKLAAMSVGSSTKSKATAAASSSSSAKVAFPAVPTGGLTEEQELAALEAEMGL